MSRRRVILNAPLTADRLALLGVPRRQNGGALLIHLVSQYCFLAPRVLPLGFFRAPFSCFPPLPWIFVGSYMLLQSTTKHENSYCQSKLSLFFQKLPYFQGNSKTLRNHVISCSASGAFAFIYFFVIACPIGVPGSSCQESQVCKWAFIT